MTVFDSNREGRPPRWACDIRTTMRTPSRLAAAALILTLGSCEYRRAEIPRSPAPDAAALACFEHCRHRDDMDGVRCVARCPGAVMSDKECPDNNPLCVDDSYLSTSGMVLIVLGGAVGALLGAAFVVGSGGFGH